MSPSFLTCNAPRLIRLTGPKMDSVSTTIVAKPSLADGTPPIVKGVGGFLNAHPPLSFIPALCPPGAHVRRFHDFCMDQFRAHPNRPKRKELHTGWSDFTKSRAGDDKIEPHLGTVERTGQYPVVGPGKWHVSWLRVYSAIGAWNIHFGIKIAAIAHKRNNFFLTERVWSTHINSVP